MPITNKLDKTLVLWDSPRGSYCSSQDWPLRIFISLESLMIIIGAFFGFSSTSAVIDPGNRRVRFSNNLFGILPTGKWISIEPSMTVGIIEYNQVYSAFSQGNRPLDVSRNDYRVVLLDPAKKEIMHLKRSASIDSAKEDCKEMAEILGLRIV